jgi:dissimilatory sulfite reductase related protein
MVVCTSLRNRRAIMRGEMACSSGMLERRLFEWNNQEVEVDEDGFIQQPEFWDESLALALARTDGVSELTDAHWKVIHYIRRYFQEFEIAPMIRKLCKETGFSLREIYDLFPSGPAKGACKVAGLPKPTGCV